KRGKRDLVGPEPGEPDPGERKGPHIIASLDRQGAETLIVVVGRQEPVIARGEIVGWIDPVGAPPDDNLLADAKVDRTGSQLKIAFPQMATDFRFRREPAKPAVEVQRSILPQPGRGFAPDRPGRNPLLVIERPGGGPESSPERTGQSQLLEETLLFGGPFSGDPFRKKRGILLCEDKGRSREEEDQRPDDPLHRSVSI